MNPIYKYVKDECNRNCRYDENDFIDNHPNAPNNKLYWLLVIGYYGEKYPSGYFYFCQAPESVIKTYTEITEKDFADMFSKLKEGAKILK